MSGLGLRIRTPNRNTRAQRKDELEQIALGSELVVNGPVRSDSGTSEDARLEEAALHKSILERQAADPSKFIGLQAEEVSPPNPFIRFGNSEIHMVSPLSYHTVTPIELNSPRPRIRFGSKRKHKKQTGKKRLTRKKRVTKLNLVKLLKKTLRKIPLKK